MSTAQRALTVIRPLLIGLAFVFLGLLLLRQWDSLLTYQWRLRPAWLAVSGICMLGGWLLEVRLWQRALGLVGGRLDFRTAVRIWFPSAIVRFVPGNVWQPLSMATLCQERDVRPEATLASMTLLHLVHLIAIGVIAASYALFWSDEGAASSMLGPLLHWTVIPIVVVAVILLLYPRVMLIAANWILAKLGRRTLPVSLSAGQ